jgi:DNA adenine methylase
LRFTPVVVGRNATSRLMARPFLKWAGGKRSLAPRVVEMLPDSYRRYVEPFLGAGAVFFAARERRRSLQSVLSDLNAELIAAFEVVRDRPGPLIAALRVLEQGYLAGDREGRRAFYYDVRATEPGPPVERAARTIFLNRTGYNGLYRVNSRGRFNVPHGRYARPVICDEAVLRAASAALQGAVLLHADFGAVCRGAGAGDFVYLDPPYQPLSATSRFTSYTSNGFGPDDQRRLRDEFESLTRRGVAAVLSNSDHAAIRS